jgi:hypothetical protein
MWVERKAERLFHHANMSSEKASEQEEYTTEPAGCKKRWPSSGILLLSDNGLGCRRISRLTEMMTASFVIVT